MNYYVYDFILNSPISFQELMPASVNKAADIFLEIGTVPKTLFGDALENKPFVSYNKKEYLIHIPNIGKIYTSAGKKVILEPESNENLERLKLYFLENGLASLMQQRGELVMQTAGVNCKNNGVWLLTGTKGTGKSSLAFVLSQTKNYQLFTDNTCLLRVENGDWMAIPAFPFMQLDNKATEPVLKKTVEFSTIISGIRKVGFEFKLDFSITARKINGIIILDTDKENRELNLQELEVKNATADLSNYIYFGMWQLKMHSLLPNLQKLNQLASTTKVFKLELKDIKNNLHEIQSMVHNLISINE